VLEARARGRELYSLRWPVEQQQAAEAAVASFLAKGAALRVDGLLAPGGQLLDISTALAAADVGPVSVTRPDYVFEAASPAVDALAARLGL